MHLGMDLVVTSGVVATVLEESVAAAPCEACGLLLGHAGRIDKAQPVANVARDPLRHFELDPAALIAAHRAARGGGRQVLGYYHAHPNGRAGPSPVDRAQAAGDGRVWAIAAGGAVTWWRDRPCGFVAIAVLVAPD